METRFDTQIDGLIEEFRSKKWHRESLRRVVALGHEEPELLPRLLSEVMGKVPAGGNYIDVLLSFFPEQAWPELVALAVKNLSWDSTNEAAARILREAILQRPAAVHPHLEQLFRMERRGQHGFVGAFREAEMASVQFLFERCASSDPGDRRLACQALLETRLPEALEFARIHARSFAVDLPEVGFELAVGGFRMLYPSHPLHLAFPSAYLDRLASEVTLRSLGLTHPTWVPASKSAPTHRFGGVSRTDCGVCGRRAARLIVLDPVPEGLGVTALSRLELCACLSCLGWERELVHYRHAPDGSATACAFEGSGPGLSAPRTELGPTTTLAECAVALIDRGPRFRWQDWSTGPNLHRVGGHPVWIRGAAYPACPGCGATSKFLMQLDSELLTSTDLAWLWGVGGLAYVFFCDGCKISSVLWQCL
jgi:hypothetical protein